MKYGYIRVSTAHQNPERQEHELHAAGAEKIFKDVASGKTSKRVQLEELLGLLKEGDLVLVNALDRFARSMSDFLKIVERIHQAKADFKIINQNIDTTSPHGKMVMQVMMAMAEFEREMIIERTNSGLAAARRRGTKLGPRFKLNKNQIDHVKVLHQQGESLRSIASTFNVSAMTISRILKK